MQVRCLSRSYTQWSLKSIQSKQLSKLFSSSWSKWTSVVYKWMAFEIIVSVQPGLWQTAWVSDRAVSNWVSEWTSDAVLVTPVEASESTLLLFLLCQERHDFAQRYNCEILHWEITAENKRTSVKFVLVQYSLMKLHSSFYAISWDSVCR